MKDRKRVTFHYDSDPDQGTIYGKLGMSFCNNLIITNDKQTAVLGPNLDVLGYAPDGIPLIAAKECLEEMFALVNAAIETE
ncbi:MAG TPA: hypothetical protein GXX75_05725 [Clostridiales bacterium]|nr:hypothetical protein [Clostridiales bacterium]